MAELRGADTIVYVDGLNLYNNALKGSDFKWLDLAEFGRRLAPTSTHLVGVKYFTAQISDAAAEDPKSPNR